MAIIVNNESRVILLSDKNRVLRFLSGVNVVDNDVWMRVREGVIDRLGDKRDDKNFTEVGIEIKTEKGKAPVLVAKDISDLDVKLASTLISQTLDVDVLKAWKTKVSREDLRAEILSQIEKMEERK